MLTGDFQYRLVQRHTRAHDNQLRRRKGLGLVTAGFEDDALGAQCVGTVHHVAQLGQRHNGTAPRKRKSGGHAAARRTNDDHASVPNSEITSTHAITESSTS